MENETDKLIKSIDSIGDSIGVTPDTSETEIEEIKQRAIIKISPLKDTTISSQVEKANSALKFAQNRTITSLADVKDATNDLVLIRKMRKLMKGYLDDYTKPIKEHLDAIKADFNSIMKPLEEADVITVQKMKAFDTEQQRKVREQEDINRMKIELAEKEMMANGELSEPIDIQPVIHIPSITRSDMGNSGMRANWTYEVTDFAALPNEYKLPNTSMLNATAKSVKDTRTIAGLRIYNDPSVVVRES